MRKFFKGCALFFAGMLITIGVTKLRAGDTDGATINFVLCLFNLGYGISED